MTKLAIRLARLERLAIRQASPCHCKLCGGMGRIRLFVEGRPDDAPERQGCVGCGTVNELSIRIPDPPPGVDWADVP